PDNISGKNVTILVHGFAVSRTNLLNDFLPTYTKRLYWVGHPVLPAQIAQGNNKPAYTIGISWKGDHRSFLNDPFFRNNFSLVFAGKIMDGLYFPDDEFKALQSGVPLADLFVRLSANSNQISVIAHSLGNMVVNSALSRPNVQPGMVSKYIMNEAAVAAETFAADFDQRSEYLDSLAATKPYVAPFLEPYRLPFLTAHLAQMGFSTNSAIQDKIWLDQWARISQCPQQPCLSHSTYDAFYFKYPHLFPQGPFDPLAVKDYTVRWQNRRAGFQAPTSDDTLDFGPWQGFFSGNLQKADIYNSFDNGDCPLDHAFTINSLVQAPDRSFLDSFSALDLAFESAYGVIPRPLFAAQDNPDNDDNQLWLTNVPDYPANGIWNPSDSSHMGIHIQWARLAYWYPARSLATGNFPYKTIFTGKSGSGLDENNNTFWIDLTKQGVSGTPCSNDQVYFQVPGPDLSPEDRAAAILAVPGQEFNSIYNATSANVDSHTFMTGKPYWQVWPAFKGFLKRLDTPSQNPDPPDPNRPTP
ncbi:MAG TPA: hypothetical protein VK699_03160, partial [Terriglobales bacterium]|nr:hypothetical protein [Terriglobales bacterium]